ncbi:hypothetical protein LJR234_001297 [Mesorhizobium amorphae]
MARMMTTRAISQPLPPPPDLGAGPGEVKGSFGFAIKVSSEDEKYQSTPINAQPLNGFHTTLGKCRKQGNFNPESLVGMYFPRKFGRERAEANRFGLFR